MIAAALAVAAVAFAPGADESFESMSSLPPDWKLVEFTTGLSTASFEKGDAYDGKQFLRLSASKDNHTRVFIPVSVEPGATYRFSAKIRASGPQDVPAVLTVDDSQTTSDDVEGDGEWHASRLFLRTGTADKITLVLSLGRFGGLAKGDADFDLLKLKKVDAVPEGAAVVDVAAPAQAPAGAAAPAAAVERGPRGATIPLAVVLFALVAGCVVVLKRGDRAR